MGELKRLKQGPRGTPPLCAADSRWDMVAVFALEQFLNLSKVDF